MKEAVEHSKITFENMLKQWHNLTDKQQEEIQSNIDYLNEQLTIPAVVGRSEQLKAFAEMVANDDMAYLKDANTLLKDFESL